MIVHFITNDLIRIIGDALSGNIVMASIRATVLLYIATNIILGLPGTIAI